MKRNCEICNQELSHSERFDSYFCEQCNDWKEKNCVDKQCFYCKTRPEKPNTKIPIDIK